MSIIVVGPLAMRFLHRAVNVSEGLKTDICNDNCVGGSDEGCLAEWLRRWTRNPLGNSRVGPNPAAVDF